MVRIGFNTASGMRSIAMVQAKEAAYMAAEFQYRKRYEVYCNSATNTARYAAKVFQYRKRYEVYCNDSVFVRGTLKPQFQYRKRYEVYCNTKSCDINNTNLICFNTASGMRSIAMQ